MGHVDRRLIERGKSTTLNSVLNLALFVDSAVRGRNEPRPLLTASHETEDEWSQSQSESARRPTGRVRANKIRTIVDANGFRCFTCGSNRFIAATTCSPVIP